jgi:hypothetical protein
MPLLDTSFLIEFEDELVDGKRGAAHAVLARNRRQVAAISIITLGEFAEGFVDPRALVEFLAPFRVVILSRAIVWRTAASERSFREVILSPQMARWAKCFERLINTPCVLLTFILEFVSRVFLDSDAVFGVRESCIGNYALNPPGKTPLGNESEKSFYRLHYIFNLQRITGAAEGG